MDYEEIAKMSSSEKREKLDGWIDRSMDGLMGRQMDGQMDGRTDSWVAR